MFFKASNKAFFLPKVSNVLPTIHSANGNHSIVSQFSGHILFDIFIDDQR